MKTQDFTPHQSAVKSLLICLNIACKNTDVVRIAAAGGTMASIAAAIRAEYQDFDETPPVMEFNTPKGIQLAMTIRHGCTLTSVAKELLAFYESNFTSPSEIEYSHIARAYAPDMGSTHRGPRAFVEFLLAKGLELTRRSPSGKMQNKWWMITPLQSATA